MLGATPTATHSKASYTCLFTSTKEQTKEQYQNLDYQRAVVAIFDLGTLRLVPMSHDNQEDISNPTRHWKGHLLCTTHPPGLCKVRWKTNYRLYAILSSTITNPTNYQLKQLY